MLLLLWRFRKGDDMRVASLPATAGLAVASVVAWGAVATAGLKPTKCGTISVGPEVWAVATSQFGCADAKAIVKRLVPQRVPASLRYPGVYKGLRCAAAPGLRHKTWSISCYRGKVLAVAAARIR
jgi:hypothetical protein